jgi:hypothetical protein
VIVFLLRHVIYSFLMIRPLIWSQDCYYLLFVSDLRSFDLPRCSSAWYCFIHGPTYSFSFYGWSLWSVPRSGKKSFVLALQKSSLEDIIFLAFNFAPHADGT